jgi:hypothetical protein
VASRGATASRQDGPLRAVGFPLGSGPFWTVNLSTAVPLSLSKVRISSRDTRQTRSFTLTRFAGTRAQGILRPG